MAEFRGSPEVQALYKKFADLQDGYSRNSSTEDDQTRNNKVNQAYQEYRTKYLEEQAAQKKLPGIESNKMAKQNNTNQYTSETKTANQPLGGGKAKYTPAQKAEISQRSTAKLARDNPDIKVATPEEEVARKAKAKTDSKAFRDASKASTPKPPAAAQGTMGTRGDAIRAVAEPDTSAKKATPVKDRVAKSQAAAKKIVKARKAGTKTPKRSIRSTPKASASAKPTAKATSPSIRYSEPIKGTAVDESKVRPATGQGSGRGEGARLKASNMPIDESKVRPASGRGSGRGPGKTFGPGESTGNPDVEKSRTRLKELREVTRTPGKGAPLKGAALRSAAATGRLGLYGTALAIGYGAGNAIRLGVDKLQQGRRTKLANEAEDTLAEAQLNNDRRETMQGLSKSRAERDSIAFGIEDIPVRGSRRIERLQEMASTKGTIVTPSNSTGPSRIKTTQKSSEPTSNYMTDQQIHNWNKKNNPSYGDTTVEDIRRASERIAKERSAREKFK